MKNGDNQCNFYLHWKAGKVSFMRKLLVIDISLEMAINQNKFHQVMCISVITVSKMMISITRGGREEQGQRVIIENIVSENDYNDRRPIISQITS